MYRYEDIKHLHLETTTKCNANCPMCGRNSKGQVRPQLQLSELSLFECRTIFKSHFIAQLEAVDMCGAYGDPALTEELIEIVKYFVANSSNINIDIFTNGSVRPCSWWKDLATQLGPGKVVFSIDGLKDTNYIYRQGTHFETIIRNARSFIDAGGHAQWDFIVFKHNEHQIEEARNLSKQIGFKSFQVKKTARFFKHLYQKDSALDEEGGLDRFPIYNRNGKICGVLEPPGNPEYLNSSLVDYQNISYRYGAIERYFDTTPIDCKAKGKKSIFVNARGLVYPCCWFYNQANFGPLYGASDPIELRAQRIVEKMGGNGQISALSRPLSDVIRGSFFSEIENSFSIPSLNEGRLKICARMCGRDFNQYEKQFESEASTPGIPLRTSFPV